MRGCHVGKTACVSDISLAFDFVRVFTFNYSAVFFILGDARLIVPA